MIKEFLFNKIVFPGIIMLLAVSCINNDYDPADCSHTAQIVFKWIESSPKAGLEYVQIKLYSTNGGSIHTRAEKDGIEIDLVNLEYNSEYQVVAWEDTGNVVLNGNILSIETESDGMAREPKEFNAGTTSIVFDKNEDYPVYTIPLYQQTRPLIIELKFNGPRATRIESVEGIVNGITASRYINDAFYSSSVNNARNYPANSSSFIRYHFTPDEQGWFSDQKTLLGINMQDTQELKLFLTLSDRSSWEFDLDISGKLENFYVEDIKQPWVISLVLDIGWDADDIGIIDWKAGPKSVIIVQ